MRFRTLILLTALLTLTSVPMLADTTYTYTGKPFDTFLGSAGYSSADSITGSFTVLGSLADNLSDVTVTPVSFSFSDGVQTITNLTADTIHFDDFSTDGSGNITTWYINISHDSGTVYIGTGARPAYTADGGGNPTGFGGTANNPGTWSSAPASVTPEPSSLVLLGTGVLGAAGAARRRLAKR